MSSEQEYEVYDSVTRQRICTSKGQIPRRGEIIELVTLNAVPDGEGHYVDHIQECRVFEVSEVTWFIRSYHPYTIYKGRHPQVLVMAFERNKKVEGPSTVG